MHASLLRVSTYRAIPFKPIDYREDRRLGEILPILAEFTGMKKRMRYHIVPILRRERQYDANQRAAPGGGQT